MFLFKVDGPASRGLTIAGNGRGASLLIHISQQFGQGNS